MTCLLCGGQFTVTYEGKIRRGKDQYIDGSIIKCCDCGVEVNHKALLLEEYQNGNYRESLSDADHEKHDELAKWLTRFVPDTRDKTLIDAGCGWGSFLDLHCGLAKETIGVEPDTNLWNDRHKYYSTTSDIKDNTADITVSFDVIEHVDDPVAFMEELLRITKGDGIVVITTPNNNDILLKLHPPFKEFWYKEAHKWFFDMKSLGKVATNEYTMETIHRHDIENVAHWLFYNAPNNVISDDTPWSKCVTSLGMGEKILLKVKGREHEKSSDSRLFRD